MERAEMYRLMLAGFVATFVMSILMYPSAAVQIPVLDFATFLASLTTGGQPIQMHSTWWWVGLIEQFVLGTFFLPFLYRAIYRFLPGAPIVKGLLFGFGFWVLALAIVMPLMGFGVFGMSHPTPPLLWLSQAMIHVIYGLLLGGMAGRLRS